MVFLGIIAVLLVVYFIISYFSGVAQDSKDLRGTTLKNKFHVLVDQLNTHAFNGMADVNVVDALNFNLHKDGQNQIIKFYYGAGKLTVQWKYKFMQKEVICEKKIPARNMSIVEQIEFAQLLMSEMNGKMLQLQRTAFGGVHPLLDVKQ